MRRRSALSRTTLFLTAFLFISVLPPTPALAELRAFFVAEQINSGCWVDDHESIFEGDPDRCFRMAIFDASISTIFNSCASGCTPDTNPATYDGYTADYCSTNTGCGVWNFDNISLEKVVPDQRGIYLYFGLWDDDALDATDSLGDHWSFAAGPTSGTTNNNNISPYYADHPISTVCGGDVEGAGNPNNFSLTYHFWFEDDSGPAAPVDLSHVDDGLNNTGWDNDTRLDFGWGAASDPNSGISRYTITLWDSSVGSYVFQQQSVGTSLDTSFCSEGCDFTYTPVDGHYYVFRVRAWNGAYPIIDNEYFADSDSNLVGVDLSDPVTSISSPASGTWHALGFPVYVSDSDAGFELVDCEWQVLSNGVVTTPWVARTCNASVGLTVGPTGACRDEGVGTCRVEVRSTDRARRVSATGYGSFGIDWTADPITSLLAFTEAGGVMISEGTWTQDRDPYFEWTSTSSAPIVGYSWAVDYDPDCTPDTVGGASRSLQLPSGALGEGVRSFRVRAIDQVGNCGPTGTRTVQIDVTPDFISDLRAEFAGQAILNGVWQRYSNANMFWLPSQSLSPISGYSWSLLGDPDCLPETTATSMLLTGLPQGVTTFRVRAVDEASNCGSPAEFNVAVDGVGDPIVSLAVYTDRAGLSIDPMSWQADNDPYVTWPVPASVSPVYYYSVGVDQVPDCVGDVSDPEYAFAPDALSNGVHSIQVRAIDAAGNCGDPAAFEIWVNASAGTSPGDVLDGLRVGKNDLDPQKLDLSWSESCSDVAIDYSVHEGELRNWYSHERNVCSTDTALSMTITPQAGDRYFLVVPVSWSEEGTYGTDSSGNPRPVSIPACMAVQAPPPHCP